MPYFAPVGWPENVPISIRYAGLVIYILANLGIGLSAAMTTRKPPAGTAWRLTVANFVLASILGVVAGKFAFQARGHNWKHDAELATMASAIWFVLWGLLDALLALSAQLRPERYLESADSQSRDPEAYS
jgi:glucan phosphoethanolaminetransferase (alkaline phosphatase superfamily)